MNDGGEVYWCVWGGGGRGIGVCELKYIKAR